MIAPVKAQKQTSGAYCDEFLQRRKCWDSGNERLGFFSPLDVYSTLRAFSASKREHLRRHEERTNVNTGGQLATALQPPLDTPPTGGTSKLRGMIFSTSACWRFVGDAGRVCACAYYAESVSTSRTAAESRRKEASYQGWLTALASISPTASDRETRVERNIPLFVHRRRSGSTEPRSPARCLDLGTFRLAPGLATMGLRLKGPESRT